MTDEFCARSGKIRHESMNTARKFISRNRENGKAKVTLQSYKCPYCDGYHLTKSPKPWGKIKPI